jgi:hypothetical protein
LIENIEIIIKIRENIEMQWKTRVDNEIVILFFPLFSSFFYYLNTLREENREINNVNIYKKRGEKRIKSSSKYIYLKFYPLCLLI